MKRSFTLSLFGRFSASLADKLIPGFRTNKVQALLIYLLIEPDAQRRETLMTMLWPGMPERSARHNLRQTLYHLRQIVPVLAAKAGEDAAETPDLGKVEGAVPLLLANRQTIQLNPTADVEVDVHQFLALFQQVQQHDHVDLLTCRKCVQTLETAVSLYTGDFLADFYLDDSNAFEEWAEVERQRFRRKALDALETLATIYLRQKAFNEARAFAERQLAIDNLRESPYRQLMEILALNGRREEAMALYNNCRRLLAEEMGMEPTARTTALHEKIMAGDMRFDTPQEQGVRGYELKEKIGQGAYGTIYQAVQPTIGRAVAVKVIQQQYANDPAFIRRFEAEAQTIARLEHPYIVPLYDYWRDPEGAYLVMRLLRGGNLLDSLQAGEWELEAAVQLMDQVASALAAAHRQGIVHRDIKPANILFDESKNAYLSDFGIAKDVTAVSHLTENGDLVGTPDYISPEQLRHDPVTPQSDIYSLGAVLYETLTGEKPFPDSPLALVIQKQLQEPIPLVSASRPGLPVQIDKVIQRATAKRPSDRYHDALAMADAFRQAVRGEMAQSISVETAVSAITELYNPYKGLQAFQETDTADFYGRDLLVEQLVTHLAASRFLAVVGPSGSGKSSVVKAGLIPALREEAIPGSDTWFVAEMVPGDHPLEELELALLPIAVNPPPSLLEPMQKDERGLLRTIRRVLPDEEGAQLLLVIDQFEELFTLVDNDNRRLHFLNSLLIALNAPRSPLRVVVTLRADFYDRPLQIQPIANLFKQHTEIVLPLNREELTWAIREPARKVGVRMEESVVTAMVTDVIDQPGALPLLQYALTELFDGRQDNVMTLAAYQALGGVSGALAQRAEELFASFDEAGQEATRQLFLRLVTLGEGVEDTRRRVRLTELEALSNSANDFPITDNRSPITEYGRYRLLTFDHDPLTREPTVEVAHEALLREWPRLRRWLDQSRDDVRLQRSLAAFAKEWAQNHKNDGFLLRESRLDLFADWSARMDLALTPDEQAFLDASLAARQQRQSAEQARQERELETAQRLAQEQSHRAEEQTQAAQGLRRRAYFLVAALAIALVLAVVAILASIQSSQNAQTARANANSAATQEAIAFDSQAEAIAQAEEAQNSANIAATAEVKAEQERTIAQENEAAAIAAQADAVAQAEIAQFNEGQAQSLALTSGAREAFSSGDVDLALALAVQAVSVEQPPAEAVRILNGVAYAYGTRLLYESEPPGASIDFVDIFPGDPRLISQDGQTITIWDSNRRVILNQFNIAHGDAISAQLIYIPNTSYIANAYENNEIIIWDWSTGEKVQTLSNIDISNVYNLQGGNLFGTPSGDTIAIVSDMGGSETEVDSLPEGFNLTGWDIESGEQIYRIDGARGERAGRYSTTPDSGTIFITTMRFDEEGVYTGESRLLIVDLETGEVLSESALDQFAGNNYITSITVSPAGDQAFAIITDVRDDNASTATGVFISLPAAEVLATVPFDILIRYARYSPDGTQLAVFVNDQSQGYFTLLDAMTGETIRDLGSRTNGQGLTYWNSFAFTPDGKRLVSGDNGGAILVWDVETGELIQRLVGHDGNLITNVKVSPDGNTAISAGGGQLRFWDITPDANAQVFDGHAAEINVGIAISPDGTKALSTAFSFEGGEDEAILWDTTTFEVIHRFPGWFITVEFLPDGRSALLGGGNREELIVHWDIESGEVINELQATDSDINGNSWDIAISPDGNSFFFVTANSDDSGIYQFDIETLTEMNSFPTSRDDDALYNVALSPDGHNALAFSSSGDFILFDLDTGEVIRRYNLGGFSTNVEISADGERFVAPVGNGSAMLLDIASGEVIQTFNGHTDFVSNVVFTPDESQIITSSGDGTLILWDVASGEALRTFSEHDAWVNRLALSPDGTLAYSTADDGTVIVRSIIETPVDEILAYIAANRFLREFTCAERVQYRILPLCGEDGVLPGSSN